MSYRLFPLLLALALGADSFATASLDASFSSDGARLDVDGTDVSMFVAAIGRDGAPVTLERGTPDIDGVEVRTSIAAGVVEWWRQLEAGLEHGVTIDARPPGEGALQIEVEATGLLPRLRSDDEIEFVANGEVRMTYAHLVTLDADGARVPGHMEVANGRVVLSIDDDGARYPLVIDPLLVLEEARLRAPTAIFNDRLAASVSITADGTRVITSGLTSRVFLRSGTSWTLEATLPRGTTVAISPDGTRAIVATNLATNILSRTGTTWTMDANLGALGVVGAAMNVDGSRAVIARGSAGYNLYARSGTSWSGEGSGAGGTTVVAVAITRDGSRAFIGQPDENSSRGFVRELVRTGTTWAAGQTLTSLAGAAYDNFGASLALSGDGMRLVVGATERNGTVPGDGFAEVFLRGTTWTREAVLTPMGGASRDNAGAGVGISGDGRMVVVGAPGVGMDSGRIVAFGRTGTAWSQDQSFTPVGLTDDDEFGFSVAMSDAERVVVGSPGDRIGAATNAGTAYVLRVGSAPGTSCGTDIECTGGFCTDGVCCGTRCGGDCESCSAAGACVFASSSTVCRASAGGCDPAAERCTGSASNCPADVRSSAGTVCRAAAPGSCDIAETCDGSGAACPSDARMAAGIECRAASGLCDLPEVCDGTSASCPAPGASGALPSGTTCRDATGVCDLPEVCDGTSPVCPGNVLLSSGTTCGGVVGTCVSAGMCNGSTGECIGATLLPSGAACRPASPVNPCDIADLCDGSSGECLPRFADAGTLCNDLLTGLCDAPDVCAGTSADCMPTFLSGTECRAAAAPCDSAELCSGSSPLCPPDVVEAAGMSCRVSVDSTCDPVEVCDGVAASCPADVITCVDAGPRDGGVADAAPDAGAPVAASGCGCRAGRSGPSGLWILGFAALFFVPRASRRIASASRLFPLLIALAFVGDSFATASLDATFSSDGARLDVEGHEVSMFVAAIGRDGAPIPLDRGTPDIDGAEVRTTIAAGVVEWWRSLAAGLEHGVTIDARPPGDGALHIEVEATGLLPRLRSDDEVELVADGEVRMTYAHLITLDADGARVPGHMEVANGRVILSIDDDGARYPLVIDPLVVLQEASLRAPSPVSGELVGQSLAMTADGTRVIANGITARVFVRTGTTWAFEAALPRANAVAISADGTRAIVTYSGTTTVHVRSGSTWTMEADLGVTNVSSIAMDGDGRTAIVGRSAGGYRIYARSGTTWSMELAQFAGADVHAVAILRDGSRAFVGRPDEAFAAGRVHEEVRSGVGWNAGVTLGPEDSTNDQRFGSSLAVSADGTRLVVGAPQPSGSVTATGHAEVFLFHATAPRWRFEAVLEPTGGTGTEEAGAAVGISGDGGVLVVGAPGVSSLAGRVVAFRRAGTSWTQDTSFFPSGRATGDEFGRAIAMADAERFVAGSPADDFSSLTNPGTAYVLRIGSAPGTSCGTDLECAGGFCTDGVCCGTRCDGDCESCSAAGACVPAPSTTVCRASAGPCDPDELCTGSGGSCPSDERSAAATVCRAAAPGSCDIPETCDGSGAECPADVRIAAGTECRAPSGLCDMPEVCDGSSAACPTSGSSGVRASGASCREPTGVCDLREVCDGTSTACPGDVFLSAGTNCGGMPGTCVSMGTCDGSSGACNGSSVLPADAVCLAASPADPCDLNDLCDGVSTVCTPRFAASGTVCNDVIAGVCDAPDVCTGTSADCVPTFLSGTECRAPSASCDSAELCSGSSPVCPPDVVIAAGLTCRASTDTSCDRVEVCDGVATSCPADENTCVDAGPSDAGVADAAPDAGPPVAAVGCGCRSAHRDPSVLAISGFAALFLRRRRSRASRS